MKKRTMLAIALAATFGVLSAPAAAQSYDPSISYDQAISDHLELVDAQCSLIGERTALSVFVHHKKGGSLDTFSLPRNHLYNPEEFVLEDVWSVITSRVLFPNVEDAIDFAAEKLVAPTCASTVRVVLGKGLGLDLSNR